MGRKQARSIQTADVGSVGAAHGRAWRMMEWYVPFHDGHAIFYHGHEDPSDHSACGPQIFCCPRAADSLLRIHPDGVPPGAEWQFTDGRFLASWMGRVGPRIYYFFFCDPEDRHVLRFVGVSEPEVRDVLLKRLALDRYLDVADRIHTRDDEVRG